MRRGPARAARRAFAAVAALALALAWPAAAPARPGGGHTYKSGGTSSGSSSRSSGTSSGSSSRSSGSSSGSSSRSSGSSWGTSSGSSSRSSGSSSSSDSWSRRPSYSLPSGGSGASSPSSSGGGGAGGSVAQYFFFAIVGAVVLVVALVVLWNWYSGARASGWTSSGGALRRRFEDAEREYVEGGGAPAGAGAGPGGDGPGGLRPAQVVARLRERGALDEDFSYVLFEDFAYALYAEAHYARGGGRLERVAPYLAEGARAALAAAGAPGEVRDVVVGAMRVEAVRAVDGRPGRVAVVVRFEANYVEAGGEGGEGGEAAYYADERWTLEREAGARSRPPEAARVLGCPACGAPLDKAVGGACAHCGAAGGAGERDWFVTSVELVGREARSPAAAGGYAEEVGTDWPTVVDPDVRERYAALRAKDPAFEWSTFVARLEAIFAAFHEAWSSRELGKARPYLSDNLFEAQRYWVDAYRRAGLRNVTEGARVVSVHLARVTSDKHYDALTVRVFAACVDYTLDEAGALAGGRRDAPREYSEYWTLVRGAGAKGAARAEATCPNCGAPLDVNMAGHCAYCRAKVTAGAFDWVLSRIEQDEAYKLALCAGRAAGASRATAPGRAPPRWSTHRPRLRPPTTPWGAYSPGRPPTRARRRSASAWLCFGDDVALAARAAAALLALLRSRPVRPLAAPDRTMRERARHGRSGLTFAWPAPPEGGRAALAFGGGRRRRSARRAWGATATGAKRPSARSPGARRRASFFAGSTTRWQRSPPGRRARSSRD